MDAQRKGRQNKRENVVVYNIWWGRRWLDLKDRIKRNWTKEWWIDCPQGVDNNKMIIFTWKDRNRVRQHIKDITRCHPTRGEVTPSEELETQGHPTMTLNFSKLKERLQGEDVQNMISLMCLCMPMYINKIFFFPFPFKGELKAGHCGKGQRG